jgi:hypothetical protein
MRGLLAFLGVVVSCAACWFLGHRQGQRVPIGGSPHSGMWGLRCPSCGKAVDADRVDPARRVGPRGRAA